MRTTHAEHVKTVVAMLEDRNKQEVDELREKLANKHLQYISSIHELELSLEHAHHAQSQVGVVLARKLALLKCLLHECSCRVPTTCRYAGVDQRCDSNYGTHTCIESWLLMMPMQASHAKYTARIAELEEELRAVRKVS